MTDNRVAKGEAQEDQITASIEKFTAQIPSSVYLALALGSMAASLAFQASKKQHEALFIGQWAAPGHLQQARKNPRLRWNQR